jgi:hypothetical protein
LENLETEVDINSSSWLALQYLCALAPFFQFPDIFTIGRTPWTSDQLVARPLPKHRTAQTQNKHIHTPNIQALSGIRTNDNSVRASEDISYLGDSNSAWKTIRENIKISAKERLGYY